LNSLQQNQFFYFELHTDLVDVFALEESLSASASAICVNRDDGVIYFALVTKADEIAAVVHEFVKARTRQRHSRPLRHPAPRNERPRGHLDIAHSDEIAFRS
jgi:hypothetical protein